MLVIKVPSRECSFDVEHEFIQQISSLDEDVCFDMQDVYEIYARVLAFIVHYGKIKNKIMFKNVHEDFEHEYGKVISVALGVNFKTMIEGGMNSEST